MYSPFTEKKKVGEQNAVKGTKSNGFYSDANELKRSFGDLISILRKKPNAAGIDVVALGRIVAHLQLIYHPSHKKQRESKFKYLASIDPPRINGV